VVISDPGVFQPVDEVLAGVRPVDRNVIGDRVLTDEGTELGEVTDVVVAVAAEGQIVGYEIAAADHPGQRRGRRHLYLPLPDTLAVSGEALVVPAAVTGYIRDDLSGFGAAVDDFRASLS